MSDRANIIKYKLYSDELGFLDIPEPINYDDGNKDVIERESNYKTFVTSKAGAMEIYGGAFDYLLGLIGVYGLIPNVRLIESKKSDYLISQKWKETSNVGLDLGTCDFDMERKTVKVETQVGGLMQIIDTRFDDEYNVYDNESAEETTLSDLKLVDVKLDSRQIFRRSRLFVDDGEEVFAVVSGSDGLNARSIPFKVDYQSDDNVNNVLGTELNANNGNYTTVSSGNSGNLFYLVSDRPRTVILNGTVKTRIKTRNSGSFSLDLVRYTTEDLLFDEVVLNLDTCNPNIVGDICSYTFNNYEVDINVGDSLAITTLSDTSDGIVYEVFDTEITIKEDSVYPITYSKSIKAFDLLERLVSLMTGKESSFKSTLFESGGKYENLLFAHGTQLRNMPRIINEGEDDETEIQSSTSMQDVIDAISILEPLCYGVKKINNKEYFYIESEKETQRSFTAIKLGVTTDKFRLIPVSDESRGVIPDNYYSSINIGSETTGSEYGEVNNLYSICGNATWNTINSTNKSAYEVLTSFRTGSVDIELTRQKQYDDNPDTDSDYDDDWFMIDSKKVGVEYHLKKWQDYYDTIPTNVYSPETEYNFKFTPYELLKGHGWKLNSGLIQYPNKSLKFISSNCSSSLITDGFKHDDKIPHSTLDKPTFSNMTVNFKLSVNQEISEMLRGTTNGIDNKFGLVQFYSEGIEQYGRLIKVDENDSGSWELIEAYI
ncbi:structural protein [Cellulophaga phage phi19:1]|uniref:Structural protein n=1 Tax=Cellulophaga phage phi19:1 TaxID=1327970 RepID=R9ZYH6_9CAUD|nr:virion structural protein [Cellulophaga phage phi19:1]AGO47387.1 structural protein [Cellulophaga phage phi19:1]